MCATNEMDDPCDIRHVCNISYGTSCQVNEKEDMQELTSKARGDKPPCVDPTTLGRGRRHRGQEGRRAAVWESAPSANLHEHASHSPMLQVDMVAVPNG